MLESSNYYEILGIASQAATIDIKKAYFAAVRKYPPERFPEEFKKIREAYDTLSDPESRAEYDTNLESEGFGQYYQQADQAYEEGRYVEAIALLKKALELLPGNRIARNLIGLCLLEQEEYDKAAAFYKKLVYDFRENAVYRYYLGEALLGKGAYKQALEAFENALRLDRGHVQSWIQVGFCYFALHNYEKARQVLENGIRECGENVSFYMKLIFVDVSQKDMDKLLDDIDRLEILARKDQEMKENVAWYLAEIAERLMQEMPDVAAELLEKAKKLSPHEKEIKTMYKDASKIRKLQEPLDRLKKDPRVHPWIKDIAKGAIRGFDDPLTEMELSICERLLLRDPANVLSSVEHLKFEYPEIFKEQKKFFQKILDNPRGAKVDERELLSDMKALDILTGRISEHDSTSLEDVYIPPMQRINTVSVGRNDPCPCGSGKKYKKCCGK